MNIKAILAGFLLTSVPVALVLSGLWVFFQGNKLLTVILGIPALLMIFIGLIFARGAIEAFRGRM
jgi:hypothetical protein